jgi:hypothetical protein
MEGDNVLGVVWEKGNTMWQRVLKEASGRSNRIDPLVSCC